jgi:hypothetical protein
MSAVEALRAAHVAGIQLGADGEDLVLEASVPPPPAVIDLLSSHKAGIMALLRPAEDGWSIEDWRVFHDERAGILEFDGELPRIAAEAQAFEACIIEWLNRNPAPSLPGRCAWCGRSERSSDAVVPFGTEPGTHAWLHCECWRPWQEARRAEAEKALSRIGSLSNGPQSERT